MDIALVRVDNRLIHGQILEAWIPFLDASCVVVVDDQVVSDFFRETVIRMAVPSGVEVIICGVAEFAEKCRFSRGKGRKTIVLFSKISDAWRARRLGYLFDQLNIGNVYNEECQVCCTPAVLLSSADIQGINSLRDAGVKIELQRVPREKPVDLFEIVRNIAS
ncbi:MAG: PTS sugar transporter subunit IIB [Deltaproteobacteria bacterium]|nr:PTS sugar transporter subunit IIB [Deltaproteobacteria bacterium]